MAIVDVWISENKEYLEALAEKQREEAANVQKISRRKRKRERKETLPAQSAAEATMETLKKKVSAKINYPALAELFEVDMTLFEQSTIKQTRITVEKPEVPLEVTAAHENDYSILVNQSESTKKTTPNDLVSLDIHERDRPSRKVFSDSENTLSVKANADEQGEEQDEEELEDEEELDEELDEYLQRIRSKTASYSDADDGDEYYEDD